MAMQEILHVQHRPTWNNQNRTPAHRNHGWQGWNDRRQANTQRFRPGGRATNNRVRPQEQAAQRAQASHPQNPNPLN